MLRKSTRGVLGVIVFLLSVLPSSTSSFIALAILIGSLKYRIKIFLQLPFSYPCYSFCFLSPFRIEHHLLERNVHQKRSAPAMPLHPTRIPDTHTTKISLSPGPQHKHRDMWKQTNTSTERRQRVEVSFLLHYFSV